MQTTRSESSFGSVVRWLAISALVLRALIPLGYMPASLASGTPFVLCPGSNTALTRFLKHAPSAHEHEHDQAAGSAAVTSWEQCSFALASVPVLPNSDNVLRINPTTPVLQLVAPHIAVPAPEDPAHRAREPPAEEVRDT